MENYNKQIALSILENFPTFFSLTKQQTVRLNDCKTNILPFMCHFVMHLNIRKDWKETKGAENIRARQRQTREAVVYKSRRK